MIKHKRLTLSCMIVTKGYENSKQQILMGKQVKKGEVKLS